MLKSLFTVIALALPISASVITTPIQGTAQLAGVATNTIISGPGVYIDLQSDSGTPGIVICLVNVPCQFQRIISAGPGGELTSISGTYLGRNIDFRLSQFGFYDFTGSPLFGSEVKPGLKTSFPVDVVGDLNLEFAPNVLDRVQLQARGRGSVQVRVEDQDVEGNLVVQLLTATFSGTITQTPEPSSIGLAAIGLLGFFPAVWRVRTIRRIT